jgi:hypothetical protein
MVGNFAHSPNTSQDFPCVQNSQELIISGGVVKVGLFLVHKKCIWHPDQLNVFSANH